MLIIKCSIAKGNLNVMIFIFDLDGTLTECETLPKLAQHFNIQNDIENITEKTVKGDIPFMESFIKRVSLFAELDIKEVSLLLSNIPINKALQKFINANSNQCLIATGNYRGWVADLASKFTCELHASEGETDQNGKLKLTKIFKKEDLVREYQAKGEKVVFVGDGNNDAEAMRLADISIACGIVHSPANSVMQVADYVVYDSSALLRLLHQIKKPQNGKSLVISAAGIGSRLGLSQTKALIPILGRPLILHQLSLFSDIEDVRVVIGYQAKALIETVLSTRKDIIFVFNHDYFHTNTGISLYLGARHANEKIIAWDGDLLVHPEDVEKCLASQDEYIGVSTKVTEQAVYVDIDQEGRVLSFSRLNGEYEWSGPACLYKKHLSHKPGHVYNQIEPLLPMPYIKIRACDIDTYEDYKNAIKFVKSWQSGNAKIDAYYTKLAENIRHPIETRNKAADFSEYDIALVKRFACKELALLDLGSGTGLLVNHLIDHFGKIVAIEKYEQFSKFIINANNIQIINTDLLTFDTEQRFDVITIFGVLNFFNTIEAAKIYKKIARWLKQSGIMIVKHQMGCQEDVIIDGFSEELATNYYSEYRSIDNEVNLISNAGFEVNEIIDIYPKKFNRWDNTHFYALVCGFKN